MVNESQKYQGQFFLNGHYLKVFNVTYNLIHESNVFLLGSEN